MNFDLVLRLGDIVQVMSIAAGGLLVFSQMRVESKSNRERLDRVEDELAKQTEILTRLAAGDARMDGLERRLQLLEKRAAD